MPTAAAAAPPIRRPRWFPDGAVSDCGSCGASFGLIRRKHHCRRCGGIFCDGCTKQRVVMPAEMGYGDDPQRICAGCTPQFDVPRRSRSPRSSGSPAPRRASYRGRRGPPLSPAASSSSGGATDTSPSCPPGVVVTSPERVLVTPKAAEGPSPRRSLRTPSDDSVPAAKVQELEGAERLLRADVVRRWREPLSQQQQEFTRALIAAGEDHMRAIQSAQQALAPALAVRAPTPTDDACEYVLPLPAAPTLTYVSPYGAEEEEQQQQQHALPRRAQSAVLRRQTSVRARSPGTMPGRQTTYPADAKRRGFAPTGVVERKASSQRLTVPVARRSPSPKTSSRSMTSAVSHSSSLRRM